MNWPEFLEAYISVSYLEFHSMFATLFCFHLYVLEISWEQISLTRPTDIAWGVHPDESVWDEYIEQGNLGLFCVSWSGGLYYPLLIGNDCSMAHL